MSDKRDCECPFAQHEHGTVLAYNQDRCRCRLCRDAAAAYFRKRYKRHAQVGHGAALPYYVDRTGTRRRLEALAAVGWHDEEIGALLGTTGAAVGMLRASKKPRIYTDTALRIAEIYDQLADKRPEPWDRYRTRRVNNAKRWGWLVPAWWDDDTIDNPDAEPETDECVIDEIAVERLMGGLRPAVYRREELIEAMRRLSDMGLSGREIGQRVGMHLDAVNQALLRARKKEGEAA